MAVKLSKNHVWSGEWTKRIKDPVIRFRKMLYVEMFEAAVEKANMLVDSDEEFGKADKKGKLCPEIPEAILDAANTRLLLDYVTLKMMHKKEAVDHGIFLSFLDTAKKKLKEYLESAQEACEGSESLDEALGKMSVQGKFNLSDLVEGGHVEKEKEEE